MFILWWVIVGLIAGWITGKIMKGSGYGVVMALGFAGEGGMIYTRHRGRTWCGDPDPDRPVG